MATSSPPFPKLRSPDPILNRVQDNISNQLQPVADAVAATPLLGGATPGWITPNLLNGVLNTTGWATTAFNQDALRYVHGKGVIINSTGVTMGLLVAYVLPLGYRPSEQLLFASVGVVSGTGAVAQSFSVSPNGAVTIVADLLNGASMSLEFTFLAEQ